MTFTNLINDFITNLIYFSQWTITGTSLVVQWLKACNSTAWVVSSSPGQEDPTGNVAKKKKKELLQKSLIHKEHSSSFFGWCICLPHNTKLCKGREHDLLINILLVPSSNAWHKVVTQLSCGRINVEQSSPHIHIKQCPKPFPVWSNSSSTITLEQYSNFFTVGHKENLCCLVYLYFNGITTFHAWVLW